MNLFRHNCISKFTGKAFVAPESDVKLIAALNDGIESIVLRQETPIETRREIATLLNDTHDYKWTVDMDGNVDILKIVIWNVSINLRLDKSCR